VVQKMKVDIGLATVVGKFCLPIKQTVICVVIKKYAICQLYIVFIRQLVGAGLKRVG
jgi:hypothetical protein